MRPKRTPAHVSRTLTRLMHVRKLLTFDMPKCTLLSARAADNKHVPASPASHYEPDALTSPTVTGSKQLSPKHTTGLQDAGRSFRLGGRKIAWRCAASLRGTRNPARLPVNFIRSLKSSPTAPLMPSSRSAARTGAGAADIGLPPMLAAPAPFLARMPLTTTRRKRHERMTRIGLHFGA